MLLIFLGFGGVYFLFFLFFFTLLFV